MGISGFEHQISKLLTAGGTVNAYRIVKFGADEDTAIQATAASDLLLGVADIPQADTPTPVTVGQGLQVVLAGIATVECGGTITEGAFITSDSVGRAVAASSGNNFVGQALRGGVSGDLIPAQIFRGSDGTFSYSASAADVNTLENVVNAVNFTIGSEAANVINVGLQLQDADGADIAVRTAVQAYLSDDADGDSVAATAPDGNVAIGTDGELIPLVADKAFTLISEADGDIDLDIGESGADTWYLIVILPNGKLIASTAITFA